MKKCKIEGCTNDVWGGLVCKYHQYTRHMRGGDLFKPRKSVKKQIPPESKKRKVDHVRYLDRRKAFIQKRKDEGTYFCDLCLGEFDPKSRTRYCTIEHSLGRVGDNYKDENHWLLMHCECNFNMAQQTIDWFKQQPYWNDFLVRLKVKDKMAWEKLQRKIEKSGELFDNIE